ncbi:MULTISPECIES: DUF3905 domain-containing protein [Bacillaceae]|uniref:DUF3905 domain-containing protein n=1 Tax=Evansella alkalicola TaxID=745819 RepID=A0ABS6JP92_9BACI|nr:MULTISPECIES: DUF3905 domain-containing protein [Bacillaceae]MBU9720303.1 DUF3905 domain-containing protein [Bacillus alkalicola]
MKKKREFEPNPETPLDHWDDTIDPAIMSGDHWVEEEEAPLLNDDNSTKMELETHMPYRGMPGERFMHPTHQVGEKKWNDKE